MLQEVVLIPDIKMYYVPREESKPLIPVHPIGDDYVADSLSSYLIGYADRLANDCCPPHHQVRKYRDPNDAAEEGNEKPLLLLLEMT